MCFPQILSDAFHVICGIIERIDYFTHALSSFCILERFRQIIVTLLFLICNSLNFDLDLFKLLAYFGETFSSFAVQFGMF